MPERSLVEILLTSNATRNCCPGLAQWLPIWRTTQSSFVGNDRFSACIAASLRSDRLAWAFFSGYQGAMQSAFSHALKRNEVSALCVHEAGRKLTEIATVVQPTSDGLYLHGHKSWALAGIEDLRLLVLARRGDGPSSGPGSLVMVRLESNSEGVEREFARPQTVVPEMAHSGLRLDSVRLNPDQLMPGDGYTDYAKPFRVFEDIFVTGSTLAYLLSEANSGSWPATWRQRCIAAITMLGACADLDLRESRNHIPIAGALSFAGDVVRESDSHWQAVQEESRNRWQRDRQLLSLGKDARRTRAMKSWTRVQQEAGNGVQSSQQT